jgi:hypothetical protein
MTAGEANEQAFQHLSRQDMKSAFYLFQKASDLEPHSIEYANNAGTAALRADLLTEARKYLERALAIDPQANLPRTNLKDLERRESLGGVAAAHKRLSMEQLEGLPRPEDWFVGRHAPQGKTVAQGVSLPTWGETRAPLLSEVEGANAPSRFHHRVRPLPRLTLQDLYKPENALFRFGRRPFVLVNVANDQPRWKASLLAARRRWQEWPHVRTKQGRPFPKWDSAGLVLDTNSTMSNADRLSMMRQWFGTPANARWPTGAAGGYSTSSTWTLNALSKAFGDRQVDAYPHNMEASTVQPKFMSLRAALRELRDPLLKAAESQLRPNSSYVQWNMAPDDWATIVEALPGPLPEPFGDADSWFDGCLHSTASFQHGRKAPFVRHQRSLDETFSIKTHWRMMLVGSWSAGMFGHWDVLATSSWQIHIAGAKRWHICPPDQRPLLGDAGEFDGFNPDYASRPQAQELNCFLDVVVPGDFLFYPKNYWHQTENLVTPTVSITDTVTDHDNYRAIASELARECNGLNRVMGKDDALCEGLDRCYHWWEAAFEGMMVGPNATDVGRSRLASEYTLGSSPLVKGNASTAWVAAVHGAERSERAAWGYRSASEAVSVRMPVCARNRPLL